MQTWFATLPSQSAVITHRPILTLASAASVHEPSSQASLQSVLRRVVQLPSLKSPTLSYTAAGTGTHLGVDITWQVCWRPNGAFREDIHSQHMSSSWGYDGKEVCWEMDHSKCPRHLERDDHEAALLSVLVRSGAWLQPEMQDILDIELMQDVDALISDFDTENQLLNTSTASAAIDSPVVVVSLRLKNGHVTSQLCLHPVGPAGTNNSLHDLLPGKLTHSLMSDKEIMNFSDWQPFLTSIGSVQYPRIMHHDPGSGQINQYETASVALRDELQQAQEAMLHSASFFRMPESPLLPKDTTFASHSSSIPAWFTPSGHVVVKPLINNQAKGLFILDTGASCFVIEPHAADSFNLTSFGDLHVTGMTGKVASKFRKADSIQLGPLTMQEPMLVEMDCSRLVRGAPDAVIGIIGHEIFRRAVIDMPAPPLYSKSTGSSNNRPASEATAEESVESPAQAFASNLYNALPHGTVQYEIQLHDPETFDFSSLDMSLGGWVPLQFVAGLPHVTASIQASDDADGTAVLEDAFLMLDTGAGGADVMLNNQGVVGLKLHETGDVARKTTVIRGVGGDLSGSIKTERRTLHEVKLQSSTGAVTFNNVSALCSMNGKVGGGMELSYNSTGILGASCFFEKRRRVVFDIARRRMFVHYQ